jgi:hypothetical protein
MVVRKDDSRAAMFRGIKDDFADRERSAARVTFVAGKMEATRSVVDMCDPETLAQWISFSQAARKEVARRG